jgi:GNAT superfamily N-acetyltransferase
MNIVEQIKNGYLISTDKSKLQTDVIYQYLSKESYWAANIPLETIKRCINGSICFGIYINEKQIGFARVVSDTGSFAYLADVFILNEHRGKGLSKWMMKVILAHPDLQGLRRWLLATKDAHSLYAQFGFTALDNPDRFMQIHNPDVYRNK